ncbi:SDR family oxidoreductase [Saccharibacillus endophyticus]|uniref:NAD-dependent epimerase/dehydratase n=1 Tax=Saccharibacillus endophyticus TaxID=2060666 RepID=A0ABQ1ZNG8_9BACL|nr:SDR family oxidoreductase [Saccharibacillus endophyticus]GGH69939.1 putative NAD-dependent epimerase/dehydratase [Saccharibacillus endophyticus]
MKVFVTGATGFIGTAVVRELLEAGHEVVGLARSGKGEEALKAAGADVWLGSLEDLDGLRRGAEQADGVIHLAYIHDFSDRAAAEEADRQATEAIGEALAGTGKPVVLTSGTLMLPQDRIGTEDERPVGSGRYAETGVDRLTERGIRASVVRLSPTVHGEHDYGFVRALVGIAREKGFSAYVEDGSNHWPAVHRSDAARLFRLALESAPAGTRLHGVAEQGVLFRSIAEVIGRHLNLPVQSIPAADAPAHFGWLNFAASANCEVSSDRTQHLLNWKPEHPELLEDLEAGYYFRD